MISPFILRTIRAWRESLDPCRRAVLLAVLLADAGYIVLCVVTLTGSFSISMAAILAAVYVILVGVYRAITILAGNVASTAGIVASNMRSIDALLKADAFRRQREELARTMELERVSLKQPAGRA